MSEPLPNCPLCAGAMQLEGGPTPFDAWCVTDGCAMHLVDIPLAALAMLAAMRKPLTPDEADAKLQAYAEAMDGHGGRIENEEQAALHAELRDALTGKR